MASHSADNLDQELPSYTPRRTSDSARSLTEHTYSLSNRHSVPWITLRFKSRASSARLMPVFGAGDQVQGTVELNLERPDHIESIVVTIRGEVMNPSDRARDFLNSSTTVWDLSKGDPNDAHKPATAKLRGAYSWPFSFSLPTTVDIPTSSGNTTFPLPQTYKGLAHIAYRLVVTVGRGRLRVDNELGANIGYLSVIRAEPPSALRQLAYMERSPLLGPEADPEGWISLPPATISGTVFSSRTVEVKYTLHLARPHTYARGTVIPLILDVQCTDAQAADLLGQPSSPLIALILQQTTSIEAALPTSARPHGTYVGGPERRGSHKQKNKFECIATASWWSSREGQSSEEGPTRRLDGEIHLPKQLSPSFVFSGVMVQYLVQMLAPLASGFLLAKGTPTKKPLIEVPVVITTHSHGSGPAPQRYAPPGYEEEERKRRAVFASILDSVSVDTWAH
ncbi:hypothetical protein SISNIDRAFT_455645 [Sistotremastrum niveocremeum HHB9708]|uniref:Uncharacterized protein n=2 Tax=Sistotremastraceae TaxID=3402574 RepID=A0A164TKQ7_9AGAM|nr:hypothetical protein SISNIDRAFT_455645 [Sistotremastrum niveocremeum HHB9708]KZT39139.1 hypothetical protein SISSUDRAFT_1046062 [Sistotremastrum suecicum HHB10207 ss-3]